MTSCLVTIVIGSIQTSPNCVFSINEQVLNTVCANINVIDSGDERKMLKRANKKQVKTPTFFARPHYLRAWMDRL